MPFGTTAAQDAALDAVVSSLPSPATWRIFAGHPVEEPTSELASDGGYAPVAYSALDWSAASGGVKSATVSAGTSTGAWSDVGWFWAICDAAGEVLLFDLMPEPVSVDATGTTVEFEPTIYFRNDF